MGKKWIPLAVIGLVIAIPLALKLTRGEAAKPVETASVGMHVLAPSILASGTLAYESERKLVSEVIGRVEEVLVREGDQVKAGQLLLRLDPASALAAIARLDAVRGQSELNIQRQQVNLRTQEAKWKRYESLLDKKLVDQNTYEEISTQRDLAKVELDTSRAQLRQTEAQMKEAREQLAKTEIRSPIGGQVTAISIEAGETAVPSAMSIAGSDLMTVADTGSMYAEVNVDETDVARVGVGQEAKIVPAAFPDKAWTGTVEQVAISPRQTTGQRNYAVKIRLTAMNGLQFHPGMSCRAEISTRRENASASIAVPVQAVRYEEAEDKKAKAKASVFVLVDGEAKKRDVETGTADDAYIQIVNGLKEKEVIVTGPAKTLRFLNDGEQVAATAEPTAAATTAEATSKR